MRFDAGASDFRDADDFACGRRFEWVDLICNACGGSE
jgi:hypothetical protein